MTETNIFYETGDIQFSTCQTIVVPVNCEGTMDEGIASIFRRRYPYMFERYKWICEQGLLAPGKLWIYNSPSKRKILIFPVLQHGEERYRYMELGLAKFLVTYQEKGITSVAFPLFNPTGTKEKDVLGLMSYYLAKCDIAVEIYTEYIPRSQTLVPLLERLCGKFTDKEIYNIKKKLCLRWINTKEKRSSFSRTTTALLG